MARVSLREQAFLDGVIGASCARPGPAGQGSFERCSVLYLSADLDQGTTTDALGQPGAFRRLNGVWQADKGAHKPLRNKGALAALQDLGASGVVRMDFEDARLIGTPRRPLAAPVMSYCRRPDATNVVLWPLSQYHDLGTQRFLGKTPPDTVDFVDKLDAVAWRGKLSGDLRSMPSGRRNPRAVLAELDHATTPAQVAAIVAQLRRNVRFGLVYLYAEHPDFDVGLTCNAATAAQLSRHKLGHLVGSWQPMSWLRRFRYILSVRGNDTGSNFIPALDSNSVVLREQDGWELFYSGVIHPWEHYIPLAPFLTDLDEKLDWARANPSECRAIAARAREICTLLGHAKLRQLHLHAVYDHYRSLADDGAWSACP